MLSAWQVYQDQVTLGPGGLGAKVAELGESQVLGELQLVSLFSLWQAPNTLEFPFLQLWDRAGSSLRLLRALSKNCLREGLSSFETV